MRCCSSSSSSGRRLADLENMEGPPLEAAAAPLNAIPLVPVKNVYCCVPDAEDTGSASGGAALCNASISGSRSSTGVRVSLVICLLIAEALLFVGVGFAGKAEFGKAQASLEDKVRFLTVHVSRLGNESEKLLADGRSLRRQRQSLRSEHAAAKARWQELETKNRQLVSSNTKLLAAVQKEHELVLEDDDCQRRGKGGGMGPYLQITGHRAHELPLFYGQVPEKTIWSYWFDPKDCPSSQNCTLPPAVQLCVDTVDRNKGSFDHKIVHMDEVDLYVNGVELPFRWHDLQPAQQKDSLMNALLARYGGVAFDISSILLRPIDDYWDEMLQKGATFRGYMYRINGLPWRHAESTTVWFLMSRREGIFSSAVRSQVIGMGDRSDTGAYKHPYLALGDQTLTPILTMLNYSLPKCHDDPVVNVTQSDPLHQFYDQEVSWCPEYVGPDWFNGLTGPERNDTRILLRDPRDGPQLPFAFEDMVSWNVSDTMHRDHQRTPGSPMQAELCDSMKSCWEDVFLRRYHEQPAPGEARLLSFVKIFKHAAVLDGKSRAEILQNEDMYFVNWLRLAGITS